MSMRIIGSLDHHSRHNRHVTSHNASFLLFFQTLELSEQELVTSPLYNTYSSEEKWTKVNDPCIYITDCHHESTNQDQSLITSHTPLCAVFSADKGPPN
jgi:hypothetical protein